MRSTTLALGLVTAALLARPARAADWTPAAWAGENTLELRTTAPGEAAHWFPVWLVVIDDQLYVRLGSRAAGRITSNTTAPYVGLRIAGHEFERVKTEDAPDRAAAVAEAMAAKYWSDVIVHYFNHPMTLRLVAAPSAP